MRLTKLRHNSHTVVEARRFGADAVHNEWQKWTNDFAERWVASRHRAAFHCLSSHLLMCRSSASLRPLHSFCLRYLEVLPYDAMYEQW